MRTMAASLLDLADQLVEEGARRAALRRRAVSTAYYAVFHSLAKSCASILLPSIDRDSEAYERVYRALDHGSIKAMTKGGSDNLQKIGRLVVQLQIERHRADYLPPKKGLFLDDAKLLVDQARRAVTEIESFGEEDRIALATSLLFKSRPQ